METQKTDAGVISVRESERPSGQAIDRKLIELAVLIDEACLQEKELQVLRKKLITALPALGLDDKKSVTIDNHGIVSINDSSDNLGQLLQGYKPDTKTIRKHAIAKGFASIFRMITAILLIILGFGMIVMPAPPYFEMFTLFHITRDDGVTIMDVISLIVAFSGVSLFITSILKFNK